MGWGSVLGNFCVEKKMGFLCREDKEVMLLKEFYED